MSVAIREKVMLLRTEKVVIKEGKIDLEKFGYSFFFLDSKHLS